MFKLTPRPAGAMSKLRNKWVAVAVGLAVLAALGVGPVIYRQHSEANAKAQAASDAIRLQSIAAAARIHDRAVIATHEAAIAAHDDAVAAHLVAVKVFATLDAADAKAVKDTATIKYLATLDTANVATRAAAAKASATISDGAAIETQDAANVAGQRASDIVWNNLAPRRTDAEWAAMSAAAIKKLNAPAQKAADAAYDAEFTGYAKWRAPAAANLHKVRAAAISAGRLAAETAFKAATTTWLAADAAFGAGAVSRAPVTHQTVTATPALPCVAATKAAIAANAASPTGRALARARAAEAAAARKYGVTAAEARNTASPTGIAVSKAQAANNASPTGVALQAATDARDNDTLNLARQRAAAANDATPTAWDAEYAAWDAEHSNTGANGAALRRALGNNTLSPTGSDALLAADAADASPAGITYWTAAALNVASPTWIALGKAQDANHRSPTAAARDAIWSRYRLGLDTYMPGDYWPAYTTRSHAISKAAAANVASPTWAAVMKASCRYVAPGAKLSRADY